MKKIILTLLLFAFGICTFAKKEYVNVVASDVNREDNWYIYLSGAVPPTMSDEYNAKIGDILCMLAKEGFVVEQMAIANNGGATAIREVVLLSRDTSGPNTDTKKQSDPLKRQ